MEPRIELVGPNEPSEDVHEVHTFDQEVGVDGGFDYKLFKTKKKLKEKLKDHHDTDKDKPTTDFPRDGKKLKKKLKDHHDTNKDKPTVDFPRDGKKLKKKLKDHHDTDKDKPTVDFPRDGKWIYPNLLPGKFLFKWLIIVLNVMIELYQAILSQLAAEGMINKTFYGKICVISASVCVVMSLLDIVFEVKEGEVRWQKKGMYYGFYYPGKHGRKFGSFWLGFGLLSSMVQFWLNLVECVTKGTIPIRFEYFPLLLSVCFMVAAFGNGRKSMWGMVKCDVKHGKYEIEGRFVQGSWLFACPSCEKANRYV